MSLTTPTLQRRIQISVFFKCRSRSLSKNWYVYIKSDFFFYIYCQIWLICSVCGWELLSCIQKNLQPWRVKNLLRTQEIWAHIRLVSTEQLIVITAERQGHGEWAQNIRRNEITGQWGTILLGDGTGQVRLRWAHRFTLLKNKSKGMLVLGKHNPRLPPPPSPSPRSGDPPFNITCFSKWMSLLLILLLSLWVLFISGISQGCFVTEQNLKTTNFHAPHLFCTLDCLLYMSQ